MSEEKECQCHHHEHHEGCCGEHSHEGHEHSSCCGGHHHEEHDHHCCCGSHDHEHIDEPIADPGLNIQFSGTFPANIETVWQMLTENDQLAKWFPELSFELMAPGGTLVFRYKDGGSEEMLVLDVEEPRLLSFTWDINIVAFELMERSENETDIVFTEWLSEVNDHSPRDLTMWMIALQILAGVLEGKEPEDREAQFQEFYPKIKEMLAQQSDYVFE